MVKDNKKFGFSLAEALVSMLVLSLFFAGTAKVMTGKQKQEIPEEPHGYVECYYEKDGDTNVLYVHKAAGDTSGGDPVPANDLGCLIQPVSGARYYIIHDIEPDGTYKTMVEPIFNTYVYIKPGDCDSCGILQIDADGNAVGGYEPVISKDVVDDRQSGDKNQLNSYFQASASHSIMAVALKSNIESESEENPFAGKAVFISW